jgi:hypothetical protein
MYKHIHVYKYMIIRSLSSGFIHLYMHEERVGTSPLPSQGPVFTHIGRYNVHTLIFLWTNKSLKNTVFIDDTIYCVYNKYICIYINIYIYLLWMYAWLIRDQHRIQRCDIYVYIHVYVHMYICKHMYIYI